MEQDRWVMATEARGIIEEAFQKQGFSKPFTLSKMMRVLQAQEIPNHKSPADRRQRIMRLSDVQTWIRKELGQAEDAPKELMPIAS